MQSQQKAHQLVVVAPYNMHEFDQKLELFYAHLPPETNPVTRLEEAARYFLDRPYVFEPLGEGPESPYYQEPLYRTDLFDCVTYLDTVLALAKSNNFADFKKNIIQIRYHHQKIHYTHRTDWFTDLEWIPNTQEIKWIADVTSKIVDKKQQPVIEIARTIIDKPNWYRVKTMRALHLLQSLPLDEAQQRLTQLQAESEKFIACTSSLTYVPLTKLFDAGGNPDHFLFDQIPLNCMIALARPNWGIRDNFKDYPQGYGTNLNVCHVGLSIRTQAGLTFYHASAEEGKVLQLPLEVYLKKYLGSDIKGIHIEEITVA
jgi:hypothetical protein